MNIVSKNLSGTSPYPGNIEGDKSDTGTFSGGVSSYPDLNSEAERLAAALEPSFTEPFLRLSINTKDTFVLFDSAFNRHFFLVNKANYVHSPMRRRALEPLFGRGIVNSDGPEWQQSRKVIAAAFTRSKMDAFSHTIHQIAQKQLSALAGQETVDLADIIPGLTFEVLSKSFFSGQLGRKGENPATSVSEMLAAFGDELLPVNMAPFWLPAANRRKLDRHARKLRETVDTLIDERLANEKSPLSRPSRSPNLERQPDLLDLLILGLKKTGDRAGDRRRLQDNVISMMVAGYETTAQCIIWTLHLLGRHPDWRDQARKEARKLSAARTPAHVCHERSSVLRSIIEESLRLFPPLPLITRQALKPDRFGDAMIKKGDVVMVVTPLLHRLEKYWENPEAFDPHRFSGNPSEGALRRLENAYLPFGIGAKSCIGSTFAMREAIIVISEFLRRFEFENADNEEPQALFRLSTRSSSAVRLKLSALTG